PSSTLTSTRIPQSLRGPILFSATAPPARRAVRLRAAVVLEPYGVEGSEPDKARSQEVRCQIAPRLDELVETSPTARFEGPTLPGSLTAAHEPSLVSTRRLLARIGLELRWPKLSPPNQVTAATADLVSISQPRPSTRGPPSSPDRLRNQTVA